MSMMKSLISSQILRVGKALVRYSDREAAEGLGVERGRGGDQEGKW